MGSIESLVEKNKALMELVKQSVEKQLEGGVEGEELVEEVADYSSRAAGVAKDASERARSVLNGYRATGDAEAAVYELRGIIDSLWIVQSDVENAINAGEEFIRKMR